MSLKRAGEVFTGTVVFAIGLVGIAIGLVLSVTIVGAVPGMFLIAGGGGLCGTGFYLVTGRERGIAQRKGSN